jgi:hypothetical protein
MASIQPTFITGATAKIKLNGKTLAFCADFQCSVQVITKTPKVLGKYEGDSVEPLGYMVSGSFTVVRYAKGIRAALGPGNFPNGLAENDAGNGVGNWGTAWGGKLGDLLSRNGVGNDGRAHEALDPSKYSTGTTFDIQIYQKAATAAGTARGNTLQSVTDVLSGGPIPNLNPTGPGESPTSQSFLGILNIRNARITQADFAINKKNVAIERFNFVALYVDGDGFVANASSHCPAYQQQACWFLIRHSVAYRDPLHRDHGN